HVTRAQPPQARGQALADVRRREEAAARLREPRHARRADADLGRDRQLVAVPEASQRLLGGPRAVQRRRVEVAQPALVRRLDHAQPLARRDRPAERRGAEADAGHARRRWSARRNASATIVSVGGAQPRTGNTLLLHTYTPRVPCTRQSASTTPSSPMRVAPAGWKTL